MPRPPGKPSPITFEMLSELLLPLTTLYNEAGLNAGTMRAKHHRDQAILEGQGEAIREVLKVEHQRLGRILRKK